MLEILGVYFSLFYTTVNYEVAQGACRNENNQVNDIFSSNSLTLDQCKSKCNANVGCNAVSFSESGGYCYGTSKKATTASESLWKCYYKGML